MYTLKQLALITGLTERTLRNYLKSGLLTGEKKDGKWYFSDNDVIDFFNHRIVKTAVAARKNSHVHDFMGATHKSRDTACIILDLPTKKSAEISRFFCSAVNKRTEISMTFEAHKGQNRVIIIASPETVADVLNEYHAEFK
ncbi:MAG: helix-turn-helix domain-containing protein [Clostridia bacterium]|nr:helix-turn-helix domain-containing protein [Clostridia bacterium]